MRPGRWVRPVTPCPVTPHSRTSPTPPNHRPATSCDSTTRRRRRPRHCGSTETDIDGLDIVDRTGPHRSPATRSYMQDFDDASKWVKYTVTVDGVDKGVYYDVHCRLPLGTGQGCPFQKVEIQPIAPGTVGVPPGGTIGQVLAKDSGTDYDVEWTTPPAAVGSPPRTPSTPSPPRWSPATTSTSPTTTPPGRSPSTSKR